MRGRLGGLFCGTIPELAWRDGEKPQGTLVKIVLLLWFELGTLNVSHLNHRWAYCRRRRHHNHRHRHNCHYHDQQIYCLKFQDSSVQEEFIFHETALYGGRISQSVGGFSYRSGVLNRWNGSCLNITKQMHGEASRRILHLGQSTNHSHSTQHLLLCPI